MESLAVNRNFWNARRVFITGHTGFKGSWLTLWLQNAGALVTGFALEPPSKPALFDLASVTDGITHRHGDVCDFEALQEALTEAQPEVVFHLAAQSLVRPSYENPVDTYATNVMGTVHLLEAARAVDSVRAIVTVTSDKCYENREWLWGYRETEPMGGSDPYSSSKGCAELVVGAYRRSFYTPKPGHSVHGAAIASVRAGNVIGGGDWSTDRLVPDAIRAFQNGQALMIRYPNAIRPWQHVLDPLAGYLRLAEALVVSGQAVADGWNFGPQTGNEQPVSVVVDKLARLWGGDARWSRHQGEHLHEHHYLRLDCTKARTVLGWTPRLDLDTSLRLTVDWYRAYSEGKDLRDTTLEQIHNFENEYLASDANTGDGIRRN